MYADFLAVVILVKANARSDATKIEVTYPEVT